MLKSIVLAACVVIGLTAQATASSVCEEDSNGNSHVLNWCDAHGHQ
jgi:hypothetical protein